MGIRDLFSRLKEKLDLKSTGRRKPDGTRFGTDGEGVDRVDSLSRPIPHVVAGGGHHRIGGKSNADGRQVRPRNRLPQPDVEQTQVSTNKKRKYLPEGEGVA